ncbi:MAG: biotin--[Ruminococcus sp.]|nr:biotin--[acetyl-CoA-carboxylase] ligase [Ruminococcus sp.]
MSVKQDVKKLLEGRQDCYISGEDIANKLGCSRGAVWKAVKQLQAEGYPISAVTNKGYCLDSCSDILSKDGIESLISGSKSKICIEVFDTIDSTNNYLKAKALENEKEGLTAIAARQTGGKGRLGRSFFSPPDSGLYISFLLRPDSPASEALKITTIAAVAVALAIEDAFGVETQIKWVNDVYINGKKICGILTEAAIDMESGGLEYAVCGIGINVYTPEGGFPEEIKEIAGAVLSEKTKNGRNKLAACLIKRFFELYENNDPHAYYDDYKKRLIWVGEQIYLIKGDKKTPAVMLGVDEECRLHVKFEDGSESFISSGEITIRKA